jgi:nucleoside-diphosphate-sugar epimerase
MAFVLVTGASGAIGQPVCNELEHRGHRVRGFDRSPPPAIGDFVLGSIEEREAVDAACEGVDTLVHLAAEPDDAPFETLLGPNVRGLFNVLDVARARKLRRVVLASSVQVVGGRRPDQTATSADHLPKNHYALTKLWAEQMGEMYSRVYGLSVIAARIGWMVRNRAEAGQLVRSDLFGAYLSRADAARFFALAVEAEDIAYALVYCVGPGDSKSFDVAPARELLGFEAEDAWPRGLADT